MPYALRFDGVDDVVTLPSAMSGNLGTGAYSFRIKSSPSGITLPAAGTAASFIGSNRSSVQNALRVSASGAIEVVAGSTVRYTSASGRIASGVEFDYTLTHNADGSWNLYDNLTSTQTDSGTYSSSTPLSGTDAFGRFGRGSMNSGGFLKGEIALIAVTGLANGQTWGADLSGGAGPILPTVSGTNQGTLVNFSAPACWIFYSSGGATYSGGAATSYAIDTVGGGLALRLGGAVTTYALDSTGGGSRTTSAGAPTSYALDSTGGGTRATSGGAVTTYAIGTVGGGDVIKGATSYPGGAAVTFAAESTGGGVVIRAGGAVLNFTAETTGGGTRTTSGGGAITVSLITVGGGDVLGPGYKPTITAPAVAVRRTYTGQGVRVVKTYRAPYTVAIQKTYRGATCRL